MKIYSVSPVRTPLNLSSERLSKRNEAIMLINLPDNIPSGFFPERIDHQFGYGTIEHDNIPPFLQPMVKLSFDDFNRKKASEIVEDFCRKYRLKLSGCFLYLYDDTIALLDISFETSGDEETFAENLGADFDADLTGVSSRIAIQVVLPGMYIFTGRLKNLSRICTAIISPDEFKVLDNPYAAPGLDDDAVFWTGRYIVSDETQPEKVKRNLREWVSPGCPEKDESFSAVVIGSGNVLICAADSEKLARDWQRVSFMGQYYYALCSLLENIIVGSIESLYEIWREKKSAGVKIQSLIEQTSYQVNHMQFAKIQFRQAGLGTQAYRRQLLFRLIEEWKLNELEDNIEEWAALAQKRIQLQRERLKARQNRIVQSLLAIIGALGVVDFLMNLSANSESGLNDRVPGLLDLFAKFPPDGILWASLFVLCILVYITVKGD